MMFIAINRFEVKKVSEDAFEKSLAQPRQLSRPRAGLRRVSSAQGARG